MSKKNIILILILLAIIAVGCVKDSSEKGKKDTKTLKKIEKLETVTPQGYETYISKYGFSVTYPSKRYLEESKTGEFVIYYYRPDDPEQERYGDGNTIVFMFHNEVLARIGRTYKEFVIPEDPIEKVRFLADKIDLVRKQESDVIEKIKTRNLDICLYYVQGRPLEALFYLPKKDTLVQVFLETELDYDEFKSILRTIKLINIGFVKKKIQI